MKESSLSRHPSHSHVSTVSGRRPTLSRGKSDQNGANGQLKGTPMLPSTSSSGSSTSSLAESRKNSGSKPRSLSQVLANNLHNTNQFLAQEKAYLKRIKSHWVDDYYSKGIGGANFQPKDTDYSKYGLVGNASDDDDDELSSYGDSDILTDMDDEKYQIDYRVAVDIMKSNNSTLSIDDNMKQINRDNVKDPAVIERLEWQAMLLSVLTGDVVRSEKTRIIDTSHMSDGLQQFIGANYKEELWFGIRSKLFDRSLDDQKKTTLYRRNRVDKLLEEIINYEILYETDSPSPRDQVVDILNRYEKACELWKTLEDMRHDKPLCSSSIFQDKVDALTAWLSITDAIERESNSFKAWIGNDELDVTRGSSEISESKSDSGSNSKDQMKKIFEEDNKSLAERIVKEKNVHMIFRKRIFLPLAPWMVKSKKTYMRLGNIFETLKLPDYVQDLIDLCLIPMRLIKKIITIRMKYAMRLQNPTLMMIDQMIDDFKSYIAIALEIKGGIIEYCKSDYEKTWYIQDLFEKDFEDFDDAVLQCTRYFLVLLNKKLNDSSRSPHLFRTNKEPEELEEAWNFLKNLGEYIDGGGLVVAENIALVASRLCQKLLAYLNHQIHHPPSHENPASDFNRWYTTTMENFGQLRRKLLRFTEELARNFTNAVMMDLPSSTKTREFLQSLKDTGHFLVYTGTIESDGMYLFASEELMGNESEIAKLISGSTLGTDMTQQPSEFQSLLLRGEAGPGRVNSYDENDNDDAMLATSYILAYCPPKPIVWEGATINLAMEDVGISDVKVGQVLLISGLPYYSIYLARDRFLDACASATGIDRTRPIEQRTSLSRVHQELTKINKVFFKMTLTVFDSIHVLIKNGREMYPEGGFQDLVNSFFIYTRDFGKSSVKRSDSSRKSIILMRLIQLSIDWVSFICDDCVPTDRKTFRWCVLALEFAMEMTRGFNVLVLSEENFHRLKLKVAHCMSLLISHFDIMGARYSEAEQRRLQKWYSQRQGMEKTANDDAILDAFQKDLMAQIDEIESYRSEVQKQLNSIGRVMDVSDLEYHFVTLLASSFSSVSIRWQKGKFIGGGSFGHVYAAVNLDTGGVMAVKEIVFHDSQSLKLIPSIKEEMTVLEMLNHPNVVQYFGVEVHRDKVYIFMEYCEGGSLSSLLAHGRIEDEMVIQVYALQMLEGLAYLHQSGVVHRDIKPENILLDHNGVIKFVDFGAAKVIAASGKTRQTRSISISGSSKETRAAAPGSNSMTGTPMYMSPEVITGQTTARNGVVDIWSLGCCVLEMATGRRPWANLDNEWAIMYHIAAGHKPQLPSSDQLSAEGIRFLSRCLEHNPSKRPEAAELLNDPWIIQIRQLAFGSSDSGSTPGSEVAPDLA